MDPYVCIKVLIDNLFDYASHRTANEDYEDIQYSAQGVEEQANFLIGWIAQATGFLEPKQLTAVLARAVADHIETGKETS